MLDTCICSFIMRERPIEVLEKLQRAKQERYFIVISAITYAEMRYGCIGKKASPKHAILVNDFIARIDQILSWDKDAIDATIEVKKQLNQQGTPIGPNDTAIAGHAIATGATLITNNTREFSRVEKLNYSDWVNNWLTTVHHHQLKPFYCHFLPIHNNR